MTVVDVHDNHVVVSIGGCEYTLVASKLAERIYGDRFRSDVGALGECFATHKHLEPVLDGRGNRVLDEDGNTAQRVVKTRLSYVGQLKFDVAVSATTTIGLTGELPTQVVAAAWAMAKAAGSTDKDFDQWLVDWWSTPSNAQEDLALWEAVCVDLSERAFFRNLGGPGGAQEPDETQEPE